MANDADFTGMSFYGDLGMLLSPIEYILIDGLDGFTMPPEVVAAVDPVYASQEDEMPSRDFLASRLLSCIGLLSKLHNDALARMGRFNPRDPKEFLEFDLRFIQEDVQREWMRHIETDSSPGFYLDFSIWPTRAGDSVARTALEREKRSC